MLHYKVEPRGFHNWRRSLTERSCYDQAIMKKTPLYAALDLHSERSVLGSMDHQGRTRPSVRFVTQAEALRAELIALRRLRRPSTSPSKPDLSPAGPAPWPVRWSSASSSASRATTA